MTVSDIYAPFEVNVPFKGQKEPADVQVVNLVKELPDLAPLRELRAAHKSLGANLPHLADNDAWTIAHAAADPAALATFVSAGQFEEEYAGESAVTYLRTTVNLPSVLPIIQPRTADMPTDLAPPKVHGTMTGAGESTASMMIEFKDEAHLRAHMTAAINDTRKAGRDLRGSILSQGVSQPILCCAVTVVIADTGHMFDVLAVFDGITRVTMSWYAMLGAAVSAAELGDVVTDHLLASAGAVDADGNATSARRKGRAEVYKDLRGKYLAATRAVTDPNLTRYGQPLQLPARIAVGYRRLTSQLTGNARLREFPDAIESSVAQQHTLSKAWPATAVGANVAAQSVQRIAAEGVIDTYIAEVAVLLESFDLDKHYTGSGTSSIDVQLARAVWLVEQLSQPTVFTALKRHLRALLGEPQINKRLFADKTQMLINRPWMSVKSESRGNAQKAWSSGGPVPPSLYDTAWTALFPERYVDLVPVALDKADPLHESAVATLQVAGGIALVADGLILTASGSTALTKDGLRYQRRQPPVVIESLIADGNPERERGLWLLAHAADSFDSTRQAANAFTVDRNIPTDAYRVAMPSADDPAVGVLNDEDGLRLSFDTIRDVAGLREDTSDSEDAPDPGETPAAARARLLETVTKLTSQLAYAADDLKAMPGTPFEDHETWDNAHRGVSRIASVLFGLEPSEEIVDDDPEDSEDEFGDAGEEA